MIIANDAAMSPCTSAAVRSARADCAEARHETITRRRFQRARVALFVAQAVFTVIALACPAVLFLVGTGISSRSLSTIGGGVAILGAVFIARAAVVLLVDHLEQLEGDLGKMRC